MAENKRSKEWKAILIIRIVVLAQCGIKILRLAPPNELAQGFGNGCSGEFLLDQLLPGSLDTSLDNAQLSRIHVLMLLRTALCLHQIASQNSSRLARRDQNSIVNGNNLIMF